MVGGMGESESAVLCPQGAAQPFFTRAHIEFTGQQSKMITKISDLTPDNKNANKGTKRGKKMVAQSLKDYGAGRSVLADRDGRIIAGNKTVENAGAAGIEDVILVPTDGTKLVVVQRTDLSLDDAKARELAIADNRSSELGREWDAGNLKALDGDADLHKFFDEKELKRIYGDDADKEQTMSDDLQFRVVVQCQNEREQFELLARFESEGLKCLALTS